MYKCRFSCLNHDIFVFMITCSCVVHQSTHKSPRSLRSPRPCCPTTTNEEFSEYLEKLSCASGKVIILGDFNIKILDTSGKRFVDILETFDCVQHIDKPTHNSGHLLDYIITRKDNSGVSNLYVSDFISDHRALHV